MRHTAKEWVPLQSILHNILLSNKEGLSEYALFELLKSPDYKLFSADALSDPLSLFQSHFILFNALYQLQDTWLKDQSGLLHIHCSCIRRHPWQAGQDGLIKQDKLRAYYLDWTHLGDTDQIQVEALLDSFWQGLAGMRHNVQSHAMELHQALRLLNLTAPFSSQQLKQAYRKMLHQYHPDKGGEHSQTVQLHNAYERLKLECLENC